MNSLPTVDEANLQRYWDVVRQLEPEFYLLRIALEEAGLAPHPTLPKVIRAITNLAMGTGYGKVTIYMANGVVTQIKNEEADEVNQVIINKHGEKDPDY